MTDLTFTLIASFVAVAVFIAFVVLFSLISSLKSEILSLNQRVDSRAFESTVQMVSRTTYETRERLNALAAHLNVDVKQEPEKYVVKEMQK